MAVADFQELFSVAKESFINGDYAAAEPLLKQALLYNNRRAEVFHMLGTIYYDRGKFNKAIQTFKRALEIDPSYTDASVGLSIILNDLGRYEEGREIFAKAEAELQKKKRETDPYLQRQIAQKNEELGEIYLRGKLSEKALQCFIEARENSIEKERLTILIADTLIQMNSRQQATSELHNYIKESPSAVHARIHLGELFFASGRHVEAIDQWEAVLYRDPGNHRARSLLRSAQHKSQTELQPSL
jgi:tetratricopeptide (TPR) repeat protein